MTNATGQSQQESTYYPFGGEQRVITNTVDNRYQFTGLHRDAESELDDTLFRKYAQNLGRWLSPDPLAGDTFDPQSLNRYAYVLNNPVNFTDPLGLFEEKPPATSPSLPPGCYQDFWRGIVCGPRGPGSPTPWNPSFPVPPRTPGGTPPPPEELDVSKTWQATFPCSMPATGLMSTVQSDFSRFASYRGYPHSAEFSSGPITPGGTLVITPTYRPTLSLAVSTSLEVTVTSQTANSWAFTTVPGRHAMSGTVTFMAADVGQGNVNFAITVNANFASLGNRLIGHFIRGGENSVWSNLLKNVQNSCATAGQE